MQTPSRTFLTFFSSICLNLHTLFQLPLIQEELAGCLRGGRVLRFYRELKLLFLRNGLFPFSISFLVLRALAALWDSLLDYLAVCVLNPLGNQVALRWLIFLLFLRLIYAAFRIDLLWHGWCHAGGRIDRDIFVWKDCLRVVMLFIAT